MPKAVFHCALAVVLVLLGRRTPASPLLCTALGSLWGVGDLHTYLSESVFLVETPNSVFSVYYLLFLCVRVGATLVLLQAFLVSVLLKIRGLVFDETSRLDDASNWTDEAVGKRSSLLARWSLAFGVLGLFTCGIFGIPAVRCGHSARAHIRPEKGRMLARNLAFAGLVLGYLEIPLLVFCIIIVLEAIW